MNPRINRLRMDFQKLKELEERSPFVRIDRAEGNPPEKYVLHLACKGIQRLVQGSPVFAESFYLQVELQDEYPRRGPRFQVQVDRTPVFHPNIAANGLVCIGDAGYHGWAPSMGLDDVVVRIVHMIRYENMNPDSAFNQEAATWARSADRDLHLFPLDTRQIVGEEPPVEIDILDEIRILGPDDGGRQPA